MSRQGRVLGLDLGSKTIGLAVSDPLGITAQGLPTLRRSNRRADFARVRELVDAYQVERLVVGHPLHLKGYASARARQTERFADQLRRELRLPVELFDERLTTAEAERLLRQAGSRPGRGGAGRRQRGSRSFGAADRIAACLILQTYMDQQAAPLPPPEAGASSEH